LQALRNKQTAFVNKAENTSDLNNKKDKNNKNNKALLKAQLLRLDLAKEELKVNLAYEFRRYLIWF
jgi:hypothetical protein